MYIPPHALSNVSFLATRKIDFVPWLELYLGGTELINAIIADTEEADRIYLRHNGFVIRGTLANLLRYKAEIKIYHGFDKAAIGFIEGYNGSEFECFIRVE